MRFKKFLGVAATGALVAGSVAAMAAPAQAATTSASLAGSYECSGKYSSFSFTSSYTPGLELSVDGTKASATSSNMGALIYNGAPLGMGFQIRGADVTVDTTINGASVQLTGSHDLTTLTSAEFTVPALSAASTVDDLKTAQIAGVSATIDVFVPFSGTTVPVAMTCTGTSTLWEAPAGPSIPEGHTAFDCTGDFGPMVYTTELKPTVKRDGKNVTIALQPNDLAGIVPVPVTTNMAVTMGLTVNGVAVDATGTAATTIVPSTPIKLPAVSAAVATTATKIDIKVTSMKIDVPSFKMTFPCTLAEPADAGSHTVDPAPVVVKAAATKSVTKATYKKKAKKAVIKTTVKAGKKNATGKVTIVVKKGKKVVAKKTITLKKGQATLVLKKGKLKKKGVYTVKANFVGNKSFKKSGAKKVTFRVK
ncbi:hypothetical protein [Nocardioides jishulii]|uniref:Bacterial Ig-like domain-containing protein n=1 Tax=Nocardioides jishulii TaxID=2575440 RepID=A0A4U2YLX1_9ACTN|nr:hypothetical protein [Nocardioides jishulii]QCX27421.1 hypothetical protein FCL41_07710 [Nocardioides jishulii]TKI62227.1 hypothetical protein FC770_07375 [Nocardioides jishulii]